MESVYNARAQSCKNQIVVIPSAQKQFMSIDVPYQFRQNTEFLYTTGFKEPDSVLVMKTNGQSKTGFDEVIFVTELDKKSELWEGPCAGIDGAKDLLGIENVHSISQFESYISCYLKETSDFVLWYDALKPASAKLHHTMLAMINEGKHTVMERPTSIIHSLRLVKSPAEIQLMRRSCEIAAFAMTETIAFSKPEVSGRGVGLSFSRYNLSERIVVEGFGYENEDVCSRSFRSD